MPRILVLKAFPTQSTFARSVLFISPPPSFFPFCFFSLSLCSFFPWIHSTGNKMPHWNAPTSSKLNPSIVSHRFVQMTFKNPYWSEHITCFSVASRKHITHIMKLHETILMGEKKTFYPPTLMLIYSEYIDIKDDFFFSFFASMVFLVLSSSIIRDYCHMNTVAMQEMLSSFSLSTQNLLFWFRFFVLVRSLSVDNREKPRWFQYIWPKINKISRKWQIEAAIFHVLHAIHHKSIQKICLYNPSKLYNINTWLTHKNTF